MQSYTPSDGAHPFPPSLVPAAGEGTVAPEPKPTPIAQLAGLPDFPQCALGQLIDIRGYVGVLVSIVNNSIKVRSSEGTTQSFNFHRLRTLYAPVVHPDPVPSTHHAEQHKARDGWTEPKAEAPEARRDAIVEPDFALPVVPISDLARLPDFPKCALGRHVDVSGFKGVVVEIVKQSLRVRSVEGLSRSYNAPLLQQLHKQS
jgi:hypothetical protein